MSSRIFHRSLTVCNVSLIAHFYMKIYTHQAKNDLTAWAPDKVWGAQYQPSYPLENFLSEVLSKSRNFLSFALALAQPGG